MNRLWTIGSVAPQAGVVRHARAWGCLAVLGLGGLAAGCALPPHDGPAAARLERSVELTPYRQRVMTRCFLNTRLACGPDSRPKLLEVAMGAGAGAGAAVPVPHCAEPLRMAGYCMTNAGLSPTAITMRKGMRDEKVEHALVIQVTRGGRTWLKVMTEDTFDDCEALEGDLRLNGGCKPA